MHLHRGLGDAAIVRNLFAQAATSNLNHDLALPGAQSSESFPEGNQGLFVFPTHLVARQAELNGVEEILIAERLGQELDGPSFHDLHGHRYVAVSRDEDDRDLPVGRIELALKTKAALAGHSDIENQTRAAIRWIGLPEDRNWAK